MFEHLDDPDGFTPDARFRAAVERRGLTRRRRTLAARTASVAVVAVAAAAGTSALLVDRQLDRVERVRVAGLAPEPAHAVDPYTVLFVGVDTRDGLAPDGVTGTRSDTVILARVEPDDDRVTVLPLPRDLWVDVAGAGPGRLNSAIATGGPSRLIATVQQRFGVAVNRYVEVDFRGTVAIGDAVGGLRLDFPAALRDANAGLDVAAGCQALDGQQILALARSRHVAYRGDDGAWHRDPTWDLGRIERQQAIGTAMLAALSHVDATSPGQLSDLLGVIARDLRVDARIGNGELVELFRGLAGSEIHQLRLPVLEVEHGGASVLEPGPGAEAVVEQFQGAGTEGSTGATPTGPTSTGPTSTAPVDPGGPVPVAPTSSMPPAAVPRPC